MHGQPVRAVPRWQVLAQIVGSRLAQAVGTAVVLATLCFACVHALPGDVALRIAFARLGEDYVTTEAVQRIRREEGLDGPLTWQYAAWMGRLTRGDLGRSLVSRRPVWEEIGLHAHYTLQLGIAAWLLSYLIALPLGVHAGFHPGGWVDRITTGMAVGLASLPTFLTGIGLIALFALTLRWLPPAGYRTNWHMVLPAVTLALGLAAYSVRIIRHAVADTRGVFYMTFARIKGQSVPAAFRHHGVRNATIPVVTFAALQFAFIADGFVVVESLFNYPGMGDLLVKSLLARDIPTIMGAGLVIATVFVLANLAADVIGLLLDPRRFARARQ
ncbi:MAG: ABC transporter permease [Rhodospirillales bacterium]